MEVIRVLRHNWLTRKPSDSAEPVTAILGAIVAVMTWMYWNDVIHAASWMSASREQVFQKHEYWRLWTSLFAHADPSHIVSNAILFIPLAYFLTGYFGPVFFPIVAFALGGLINVAALSTMAPQTSLIGISGLVYFMGSAWLTLYFLIGTRESNRRRIGKALFIAAALFAPQTFEPHVSYVSHFFGFVFGAPAALFYYHFNRKKFEQAEIYDYVFEDDDDDAHPQALVYALRDFDSAPPPSPALDQTFH